MNDVDAGLLEQATFCKTGDDKRPALVGAPPGTAGASTNQICPDDKSMGVPEVTDAVPTAFYARIMFDELINPDIEELIPVIDPETMMPDGTFTGSLAMSQPVTLQCGGVDVPYDGYYDPSGNAVTWPLGPSLVIAPLDRSVVATGSECVLTLKDNITDKDGNAVPMDERAAGYKWKIDILQFLGSDPAAPDDPTMPDVVDPGAPLILSFNSFVKASSLTPAKVSIRETTSCTAAGGTVRTAAIALDADDPTALDITDAGAGGGLAFEPQKTYVITFTDATVSDTGGPTPGTVALPPAADLTICFQTDMAM